MPSLYARVFLQILDSSVAENMDARHLFEDLLKLANENGVVDMTREALARRINASPEWIARGLDYLEGPDPKSRDPEHGGRRLLRLDEHRDWGWRITNFEKYEKIRNRQEQLESQRKRVAEYRARHKMPPSPPPPSPTETEPNPYPQGVANNALQPVTLTLTGDAPAGAAAPRLFIPPTDAEASSFGTEIGLPETEVTKFTAFYGSKGWKVGKAPMKDWKCAMRGWKARWTENGGPQGTPTTNGRPIPPTAPWQARKDAEATIARLTDELRWVPAGEERTRKIAELHALRQKINQTP